MSLFEYFSRREQEQNEQELQRLELSNAVSRASLRRAEDEAVRRQLALERAQEEEAARRLAQEDALNRAALRRAEAEREAELRRAEAEREAELRRAEAEREAEVRRLEREDALNRAAARVELRRAEAERELEIRKENAVREAELLRLEREEVLDRAVVRASIRREEAEVRRLSSVARVYGSYRPSQSLALDHHDYNVERHADRLHEKELAHQREMSVRQSGYVGGSSFFTRAPSAFRSSFGGFANNTAVCPVESHSNKMTIRNSGNHALASVRLANTRLSGFGF